MTLIKCLLWSGLLALCLTAAGKDDGASRNLLKNPGFEEGFSGWGCREWSGKPSKINFLVDKSSPRNGEKCAKIQWVSGGDNILISQQVPVKANLDFLLTFWAKVAVENSHNAPIQATVRFFDAAGKSLADPQHKIFNASEAYEEFRWSFTAPQGCQKLCLYLRCRKTTTYFDDVSLIESTGVYLRSCFVWLPERQLVLNLYNALPSRKPATLQVELYDARNQAVLRTVAEVAHGTDQAVSIPLGNVPPGDYKVKVYPVGEEARAITDALHYPAPRVHWPAPYDHLKVRNNFVTELAVSTRPSAWKNGQRFAFPNPRRGWVFFAFTPASDGMLQLPGARQVKLSLKRGVPVESMQLLETGTNYITALTDVNLADYTITTMAEVVADEYESDPDRRKFTNGLMDSLAMREMLRNCNVMQERFPGHNALEPDRIPPGEQARIDAWRATGRHVIHTVKRTGYDARWHVKPEDTLEYWLSRVGIRELDGIAIDEFGSEKDKEAPFFAPAVRVINQRHPGKLMIAFTCAAWYSHTRTIDLRAALTEGHHAFAPEQYLREQPTEGAAKNYIQAVFEHSRQWEKAYPGAIQNTLWCYGTSDSYPASYSLDCFASCDQKYFLDMQFALRANDPAFFGQRGVIPWIIRYTRPDTLLWEAKLIRHYLIEGKRTMLSYEYGFTFNPNHLMDGDCAEGLRHWTVLAAAPGTVVSRVVKDYGFNRGTRCTVPAAGDRVIEFKRTPGKVNQVRQTLQNLKVGKTYEITLRGADGENVDHDGAFPLRLSNLRLAVHGAAVQKEHCVVHVYPIVANNTRGRKHPLVGNHHCLVFQATAPTAELVISDEAPDYPARTYHGQPFASAEPTQKRVLFNLVQVTELLDGWDR